MRVGLEQPQLLRNQKRGEKDVSFGHALSTLTIKDVPIVESGKKFFDKLRSMVK